MILEVIDMLLEDTIAAIATAPGEAGIGIIRISGEKSILLTDIIFRTKQGKKISQFVPRRITYGYIIDPKSLHLNPLLKNQ